MLAKLDAAEQMALGGAALIILVELIFGVLLQQYHAGQISFLAAVAVVAAAWIRHARHGEVPLGYVTVVRLAGFTVGLIALVGIVGELRNGVFDDIADILGGLAYYIGAALMVAGAWSLKER
jgi:hypothetical protein